MNKEINLLRNNDNRDWSDIEWVREFYAFLQGDLPDSISGAKLKLSPKQAFRVIWYLQEHFPILPDQIEKCDKCNELFDTYAEGVYWEEKGKHYCSAHSYLAPDSAFHD